MYLEKVSRYCSVFREIQRKLTRSTRQAPYANNTKPQNTARRHGLETSGKDHFDNRDWLAAGEFPHESPHEETTCEYSATLKGVPLRG